MKQLSRIVVLAVVAAGIIVLWLVPGINQAENMTYVRIYEDTDFKSQRTLDLNTRDTTSKVDQKKKYKREKIRSKDKLRKVNGKMFSRIVQFEEVPDSTTLALQHKIVKDSLNQ
jgi:hypothetical protein